MGHKMYGLYECGLLKGLGREIISNFDDSNHIAHAVTDMSPDDLKDDGTVAPEASKGTNATKNRTISVPCFEFQNWLDLKSTTSSTSVSVILVVCKTRYCKPVRTLSHCSLM